MIHPGCRFWCPNFCGFGDPQEALSSRVGLHSEGIVPTPQLCWALQLLGQDALAFPPAVGHRSVGRVGVLCSALHGLSS